MNQTALKDVNFILPIAAVVVLLLAGCGGRPAPHTPDMKPLEEEEIVFGRDGVIYYDGPEVVFARGPAGRIIAVDAGVDRLLYEERVGEEAFPLAANPDYLYFAVVSKDRAVIKRATVFNLGGEVEDFGVFDRRLDRPYFVNAAGDLLFAYFRYGEGDVRLLAYGLPAAEPVAMSPPLRGTDVKLFPAPEPTAAYAVVGRSKEDADIYYFSEEGNETALVEDNIKFEEYYLENGRPFAIISELVPPGSPSDNGSETEGPDAAPLYRSRILDLKARGSVPVYSVSEPAEGEENVPAANGPDNLLDGDVSSVWVLERADGLAGRTVKIDFARPRPVRGLQVISDPGGAVEMNGAQPPAAVTVELSDGSALELKFQGGDRLAVAERDSYAPIEWVILTVQPAASGAGTEKCVINEVQIF